MTTRVVAVLLLGLAAAGPAAAQDKTITLPPDHEFGRLGPGPGSDIAQARCQLCHSTDYIVTQPRGDAARWDGIVRKMIKVYGAPVGEADARAIVEYLARRYGPGR
jgi:cytochrome c5